MPAKIAVTGLRHEYVNPYTRERVLAIDGLELEVTDGEFLTVVGPSGCGKTILLGILAGLTAPTKGSVLARRSCSSPTTWRKPCSSATAAACCRGAPAA